MKRSIQSVSIVSNFFIAGIWGISGSLSKRDTNWNVLRAMLWMNCCRMRRCYNYWLGLQDWGFSFLFLRFWRCSWFSLLFFSADLDGMWLLSQSSNELNTLQYHANYKSHKISVFEHHWAGHDNQEWPSKRHNEIDRAHAWSWRNPRTSLLKRHSLEATPTFWQWADEIENSREENHQIWEKRVSVWVDNSIQFQLQSQNMTENPHDFSSDCQSWLEKCQDPYRKARLAKFFKYN